jgi:hypothetical protein
MFYSVRIGITNEELQSLGVGVIATGWRNKGFGKGRRLWGKEFTEEERQHIETRFYPLSRYALPAHFYIKNLQEYNLLIRACNFFGITIWE